jgi:hypothetical protein
MRILEDSLLKLQETTSNHELRQEMQEGKRQNENSVDPNVSQELQDLDEKYGLVGLFNFVVSHGLFKFY